MDVQTKVSKAKKFTENPFLKDDVFQIETGKKSIVVGGTKNVLVNTDTGDTEAITLLHKFKEVDKDQFVKIFIGELSAFFDLSKTGLKVFGYVLTAIRINSDEVYIHIPDLMVYCGYKQKNQVYKGLAELIGNKIIAPSAKSNLWYINPKIVFNGDRVVFAKEYRLKKNGPKPTQIEAFTNEQIQNNSEG